jgi:hypothetical protein
MAGAGGPESRGNLTAAKTYALRKKAAMVKAQYDREKRRWDAMLQSE